MWVPPRDSIAWLQCDRGTIIRDSVPAHGSAEGLSNPFPAAAVSCRPGATGRCRINTRVSLVKLSRKL